MQGYSAGIQKAMLPVRLKIWLWHARNWLRPPQVPLFVVHARTTHMSRNHSIPRGSDTPYHRHLHSSPAAYNIMHTGTILVNPILNRLPSDSCQWSHVRETRPQPVICFQVRGMQLTGLRRIEPLLQGYDSKVENKSPTCIPCTRYWSTCAGVPIDLNTYAYLLSTAY